MILLHNQTQFETLIGRGEEAEAKDLSSTSIIYFTAQWCGACKRLDLNRLVGAYPLIAWYKCDIEENEYTAGFCGIRKIPSFMIIREKKILGTLGSADTEKVFQWVEETLAAKKD